jgi:hypothetical protein
LPSPLIPAQAGSQTLSGNSVQRMLAGRVIGGVPLLLLLAALFLSFSRGAWAQFAFAAALLMILSQPLRYGAHSHSDYRGLRRSGCGRPCHGLLSERASLELSYDVGRYGRFGRYGLGADLALEHPFGIGPLQFSDRFTEDPHNTFLNEFMSGGWLALVIAGFDPAIHQSL